MVEKIQRDAKILRDDIYANDKGVSFLNSEVQELRNKARESSLGENKWPRRPNCHGAKS